MIIKVDGKIDEELGCNRIKLVKFLKENTHSGKVDPFVELFSGVDVAAKQMKEDGSFPWVMATCDLDRDMEKIDCSGWELETYRRNPVVLWSHDRSRPAIGHAKGLETGSVLSGDVIFNDRETDAFGWGIGQRVKNGSLCSGSVGFRVIDVEFKTPTENDPTELVYRKQELLEFSICNIPANPFAVCGRKAEKTGEDKTYRIYDFFRRSRK